MQKPKTKSTGSSKTRKQRIPAALKKETISAVTEYPIMRFVRDNTKNAIDIFESEAERAKEPDRVADLKAKIKDLEAIYSSCYTYVEWVEPALKQLSEVERYILEAFYMPDKSVNTGQGCGAAVRLAQEFCLEVPSVYTRKDIALSHLAIHLFPDSVIKDVPVDFRDANALLHFRALNTDGDCISIIKSLKEKTTAKERAERELMEIEVEITRRERLLKSGYLSKIEGRIVQEEMKKKKAEWEEKNTCFVKLKAFTDWASGALNNELSYEERTCLDYFYMKGNTNGKYLTEVIFCSTAHVYRIRDAAIKKYAKLTSGLLMLA